MRIKLTCKLINLVSTLFQKGFKVAYKDMIV